MSAEINITSFAKGEDFQAILHLKNRNKSVLSDAATQTVNFVLSDQDGTIVVEFETSPQIVLADAAKGTWNVLLTRTDLTTLVAETEYNYDVWTTDAGGIRLHQLSGTFTLDSAVSPT